MNHLNHLLRLYQTISSGITGDELAAYWHPAAEQIEFPSLMRPAGHHRSLAEMLEGSVAGAALLADQRYEVHNAIANGDRLAVQLTWTATLAVDGAGIPAGTTLVAHVAAFYEFEDGLILRQSSYDCYEPLPQPRAKAVA